MTRLPILKSKQVISALQKAGFSSSRQTARRLGKLDTGQLTKVERVAFDGSPGFVLR